MTVFLCSRCGSAITPEHAELASVPHVSDDERDRDKETRRAPSTVPQGHYAIDAEPWGAPYVVQDDQEDPKPAQPRGHLVCREEGFVISAGSRHTVLVHPDDAAGLQPLPNWENRMLRTDGRHGTQPGLPLRRSGRDSRGRLFHAL
ncbi:hypothetical protein [Streptomyces sp. PanSC9]|uniref:hypothetical protein n=1 Tax=Streptomyces sp. PanSC9 TaxID=1520461 RepID=UPI0021A6629F|nr:hypothetical protein [Streptomyces sp. PanSC9]